MQGWRVSEYYRPSFASLDRHSHLLIYLFLLGMEDAHTTLLKLEPASNNAFFAVFDGHGGTFGVFISQFHKSVSRRIIDLIYPFSF